MQAIMLRTVHSCCMDCGALAALTLHWPCTAFVDVSLTFHLSLPFIDLSLTFH